MEHFKCIKVMFAHPITSHQTHTLDAVLLLLGDMDREELHVVLTATQNRLQAFTLHPETLKDSLLTHKTVDAQH